MEQLRFPVTKKEAEKAGVPYSSERNKNALFPSRLRELREERGVSQATLALELGVSKSTIGLYEMGDTLPDIKTAYDLASYFGVSTDYLIGMIAVRTTNMDIQGICKYTGLQEAAVEWLVRNKNSKINIDFSFSIFLSELLADGCFQMLLYNLFDFKNAIEAECACEKLWLDIWHEEAGGRKYVICDKEAEEIGHLAKERYDVEVQALSKNTHLRPRVRELILTRNHIRSVALEDNLLKSIFLEGEQFEPSDLYRNRVVEYFNFKLAEIEGLHDQVIEANIE